MKTAKRLVTMILTVLLTVNNLPMAVYAGDEYPQDVTADTQETVTGLSGGVQTEDDADKAEPEAAAETGTAQPEITPAEPVPDSEEITEPEENGAPAEEIAETVNESAEENSDSEMTEESVPAETVQPAPEQTEKEEVSEETKQEPEETPAAEEPVRETYYGLTFQSDGGGQIELGDTDVSDEDPGDSVIRIHAASSSSFAVTAWPAAGYEFSHWEVSGQTQINEASITAYMLNVQNRMADGTVFKAVFRMQEQEEEPAQPAAAETPENYTVTFMANDEVWSTVTIASGEVIDGNMPADPAVDGYSFIGWLYGDAYISENTAVTEDMTVTAVFETNYYVIAFYKDAADTEPYAVIEADRNQAVIGTLPADPAKDGAVFDHWADEAGNRVTAGTEVSGDMNVYAVYRNSVPVKFITLIDGAETVIAVENLLPGEKVTLPQNPFIEGRNFVKWVRLDDMETEVTAETVTDENGLTAVAVFENIHIYTITSEYYYVMDGKRVVFDSDIYQIEEKDLPFTYTAPASTKIEESSGSIELYPAQPTVTVTAADFSESASVHRDVEYRQYSAEFDYVYYLENLYSEGYTEIARVHDYAVLNATVTPAVKTFEYAEYDSEKTEPVTITRVSGQEVPVYYSRKNFTVSYQTNGGSYVQAVSAPYGSTVTLDRGTSTRKGYSFDGWYADEQLSEPVTSVAVNGHTTVYAKWKGENVNYTIVYMKEKYDNSTDSTYWVYDNSRSASAEVGTTVRAQDAPNLTNNINGYEKDTVRNTSSTAVVHADGSTVLTVYYKLIRYTLVFDIDRTDGRITIGSKTYTGDSYKIENAVLGMAIGSRWPASSTEIYDRKNARYFDGWSGAASTYITKQYELVWNHVAKANSSHVMTYKAEWSKTTHSRNAEYWLQQPDGSYRIEDSYTQIGLNTNNLGAKDIDGYSKHSGTPMGYTGSGLTYIDGSWVYVYRFYYDRNSYRIDYFYEDSLLRTVPNIKFGTDINTAAFNFTPDAPEGMDDYTWGGWYQDSELRTAWTFSTMPGNNLVLYAKWIAPEYTVTFDLGGGSVSEEFEQTLTVSKYHTVESPTETPVKQNSTFEGWYDAAEGGSFYDWNRQIAEDTVIYAHWSQNTLGYTVRYRMEHSDDPVMPDKKVENPGLKIGQTISETAPTIPGYRPNTSIGIIESLSADSAENVITFRYSAKAAETSYTVRYVLKDHPEISVHASKTVSVDGSQVTATEMAAASDKNFIAAQTEDAEILRNEYYPLDTVKELVLTSDPDRNVIIFEYATYDSVRITVNYVDMNGDRIPGQESVTEYRTTGTTYYLAVPTINGYAVDHSIDSNNQSKSMYVFSGSGNLTINVYYKKILTVTAHNKAKTYDGTALVSFGTEDAAISGLINGDTVTEITFTGEQTEAGTAKTYPSNAMIGSTPANEYYAVTYVAGTLTVKPVRVTVNIEPDRWNDDTNIYNGKAYTIGFRHLRNHPEGTEGVEINNAAYDAAYGRDIRDMVRDITRTETDAGFYRIPATDIRAAVSLPADANYKVTLNIRDGELTIHPAPVSVTTEGAKKYYDGKPLTNANAKIEGLIAGETAKVITDGSQTEIGTSANTYTIEWETAKKDNYTVVSEKLGDLTVEQAEAESLGLSAVPYSSTYDGNPHTIQVNLAVTEGTALSYSTDRETWTETLPEWTDVTDAQTVYVKAENSNYKTAETSASVTITPKPVTVKAKDAEKTYGETDPEFTAEVNGTLNGDTVEYTLTREAGEDAGTYAIKVTAEKLQGNYEVTAENAVFTITKGSGNEIIPEPGNEDDQLDAEGSSLKTVYDAKAHSITASASKEGSEIWYSIEGGEWTEEAPSRTDTGITEFAIKAVHKNYEDVIKEGFRIEITPKPVTVKAADAEKTYGEADPEFTAEVNGTIGEDTVEYSLAREAGEDAGTYAIRVDAEENQGNYKVNSIDAEFIIRKAAASAMGLRAEGYEGIYDGENHAVLAETDAEGSVISYLLEEGGWNTEAPAIRNVGTITVQIQAENRNYETALTTAVLKITPKPVTVTAKDAEKTYGETDPEFAAEVNGTIGNDTVEYTLAREAGEDAGTYAIKVTAEQLQGNYEVAAENAVFTITKGSGNEIIPEPGNEDDQLDAEGSSLKTVYDAKAHSITASASKEGSEIWYSIEGGEWTEEAPSRTDTGITEFAIKAVHKNYEDVIKEGFRIEITPKPVTVKAADAEKTYGEADPEFTAEVNGTIGEDTVEYSLAREAGEDAGTYAIKVTAEQLQGNYEVTAENGTLRIREMIPEEEEKPEPKPNPEEEEKPEPKPEPEEEEKPEPKPEPEEEERPEPRPVPETADEDPVPQPEPEPAAAPEVIPAVPETIPEQLTPAETIPEENAAEEPEAEPQIEVEEIDDEPVPQAKPETMEIEEELIPQAKPEVFWALINVLAAAATAITGAAMAITFLRKKKEDEEDSEENGDEEKEKNRRRKSKMLGLIPAIASIIILFITEDFSGKMVMTDRYTLLMIVLLAVNAVTAYLTRNKDNHEENRSAETEQ